MKTRTQAFLCNMAIIALSLLSILSYFFLPFWKIEINLSLNAQALEAFFPESGEGDGEENLFGNLPSYMGEEKIPIRLSIALKTSYILSSYQADAKASVQEMIDDNLNNLIDQLYTPLNELIQNAMRGISKEFLSSTLKDFYGDDKTHAELEQIFSDANVNIEEKIDTVIDALYAEDANVEEVSQLIVDNIDEVYEALQTYNPEEYSGLFDEEAKADMKESVEEVLSNFADEEGNLNMDDMLAELLLEFLGSGSAASGARGQSAVFSKVSLFAQEPTTQADSKEELKTKLRAFLTDLIPKKTAEIIVMGLQAVGYLILFTFFTWGYLILKILVKMTMPVNTIKVGLPIWLGWLPYLFFALLPTALTSVLTDPSILASIDVGLAESVAAASGPLNAFSLEISFFSCAIVSFFVAIALALFVLVYYGSIRKKLKRIKNGTLVEDPPTPKHTNLEDTLTELNEDNIQIDEE